MGDWQRILDAVLGSIALVLLTSSTWRNWSHYGPRARFVSLSLIALVAIGVYGAIEARIQGVPVGSRTYLVGAAYIWIIVAFTAVPSRPADREQ